MNINDWAFYLNDNQVNEKIESYRINLIKINKDINSEEILKVYFKIITNNSINNRAKLYYIMEFENLLIKSRIRNVEDVKRFSESLF